MREYCELHWKLMDTIDRIELKLDAISERQTDYIERTVKIEGIVTNGLSHNVANISKRLDIFCDEVKKRLDQLEEFQWFRLPITRLRDSIFWYLFKIAAAGGVLYLIIHYGKEMVQGTFK